MRLTPEMLAFLHAPDTVDFVARATRAFYAYVESNRQILIAQVLSDRYVLAYTTRENYARMIEEIGAGFLNSTPIVLGLLDRGALDAAGVTMVQNQPYLNLRGRGTLVGIVDTGIDYTQPAFRYEDGSTKIAAIYDQTAQGEPPEGFAWGRAYSRDEIDAALRSPDPYGVVPQRDENGHGTFLASVAAGRETGELAGAAPDAEIVAVKLRPASPFYRSVYCVPPEQQEAYESSAVMVGVEFILRKAQELRRPAVICIGLGSNLGGHDGYSLFEEYLSLASSRWGICVCTAAGNEAQARHHMSGRLSASGDTQNIDIKVGEQAGDLFLSLWNTVADRLSVSLRSPSGELVDRVPVRLGQAAGVKLILERARILVDYYYPLEGSGAQLTVIRILQATPGIWSVTVHGDLVLNGTYHAWLPLTGFVSPSVEFLSASPEYTVTVPSTARGVICCGAYDSSNSSMYPPSSRGPSREGQMLPSFVAPGVNLGGVYPYGPGTMSGSSAAAALLAGVCALMLQWGVVENNAPAMSTHQIWAYLLRGCLRFPGMTFPNNQWGFGRLQLMQAFHQMRDQ